MITSPIELKKVQDDWDSLMRILNSLNRSYFVAGVQINESAPKESYNLPFVLAYAVLDYALNMLWAQGAFVCPKHNPKSPLPPSLRMKMYDSQSAIPWQDFIVVDEGRDKRNDLAHKAKTATVPECVKFVDAVGIELKAWGILV